MYKYYSLMVVVILSLSLKYFFRYFWASTSPIKYLMAIITSKSNTFRVGSPIKIHQNVDTMFRIIFNTYRHALFKASSNTTLTNDPLSTRKTQAENDNKQAMAIVGVPMILIYNVLGYLYTNLFFSYIDCP